MDVKDINFMLPMDAKKWYYGYGFFGITLDLRRIALSVPILASCPWEAGDLSRHV
ncbi:MAG: hypothetical protein LBP92_05630 [Deltaproteobacteria bacterium]|jgi:hypothetical protein|nr:hypothetical protein [Deltaproteobacteria bacterium]